MKRVILTAVALTLIFGGLALAQSECDQSYIKAMQANSPAERAKLLKEFLTQCGGKGSQYENFASANLCLIGWPGKTEAETISYGEKALAAGGLDDSTKLQVLMNLSALYTKQGQSLDKAKADADQIIQIATAAKAKEPESAAWNAFIGAGHFLRGQAEGKGKQTKEAIDSYITSFNILKDNKILAELKKMGKEAYEAKDYANAEKVFRFAAQANPKDAESQTLVAQILYKSGKQAEALAMWKDSFTKTKSGDLAYNIGITLAKEAKTNPALTNDAIRYCVDAALLSPAKSKESMAIAESLYYSSDKEWNSRVKLMKESKDLIDEWAKTINTKFGDKSEDDLSSDDKREYRKLKQNIDKEQKTLDDLQAKQKASMAGFDKILAEEKQKLGAK